MLSRLSPGVVVSVIATLVLAQACYAFWPYRRRRFVAALAMAAVGMALGAGWSAIGLPGLGLAGANLVPGLLLGLALQPLADRMAARLP